MKTFSVEIGERELAKVYFLLGSSNGKSVVRGGPPVLYQLANEVFEGVGGGGEAYGLKQKVGYPIDYYSVQDGWEELLGIEPLDKEIKEEAILLKIKSLERELSELKEMLDK